jgi:hypothetical protein
MKKVYASGSCRLLESLRDGRGRLEPIHSKFYHLMGINFLGKLHNVKQHIQMIRFFREELDIPLPILQSFLTAYNETEYLPRISPISEIPDKLVRLKTQFDICDAYMFEICSLKLYERDGFQVQYELTKDYSMRIQTKEDLFSDIQTLIHMIPEGKPILFQSHFRPQIIYGDPEKTIDSREIIYDTLIQIQQLYPDRIIIHDPSEIIKLNHALVYDDMHFSEWGLDVNFNYLEGKPRFPLRPLPFNGTSQDST